MRPSHTIDYPANGVFADVEFIRYFLLGRASFIEVSHFTNVISGQVGFMMRFTLYPAAAAFFDFIEHVIQRSTSKQMFWIDARGIVAGVANKHSFWYRPLVQFVTDTMRGICSAFIGELSVTTGACATFPEPAIICGFRGDVFPKALFWGKIGVHENLLILVPSPRTLARRWDNFIGCFYSFILAHLVEYGNAKLPMLEASK